VLIVIYEEGSVSAAATVLNITPNRQSVKKPKKIRRKRLKANLLYVIPSFKTLHQFGPLLLQVAQNNVSQKITSIEDERKYSQPFRR